jgi:hypothetical protein
MWQPLKLVPKQIGTAGLSSLFDPADSTMSRTLMLTLIALLSMVFVGQVLDKFHGDGNADSQQDSQASSRKGLPRAPPSPKLPPSPPKAVEVVPEAAEEVVELIGEGVKMQEIMKGVCPPDVRSVETLYAQISRLPLYLCTCQTPLFPLSLYLSCAPQTCGVAVLL